MFVTVRHNQIHIRGHLFHEQPSQEIPLKMARYQKVVSSALWVTATLTVCYCPYAIVVALTPSRGTRGAPLVIPLVQVVTWCL